MHATRWMLGLVVGLTACFSPSTAPDGGTGSNPGGSGDGGVGSDGNSGAITASWTLTTLAHPSQSGGACPADSATMKVTITALDNTGTEDGPPNIGLFDCTAGSGSVDVPHTMDGADTGTFDVRWDITDSTGDTVVATDLLTQISAPTVVDTQQSRAATTSFLVDGAYVWLEWAIADSSDTAFTSCADANVDTISVTLTDSDGSANNGVLMFPCDATNARPAGFETQGEGSIGGALAAVALGDYGLDGTALDGTTTVGDTTTNVQLFLDAVNGVSPTPQQLAITETN
jgi:hypothetical protein